MRYVPDRSVTIIGDKRPPLPPGFKDVVDDPSRGGDDHQVNFVDILLALLAWPVYLVELSVWLATVLPSVGADLLTYPVRESLYELFVVPAYSAYLAMRKPLVLAGFLMPKHEEILRGLVELGVSPEYALADLKAALDSPDGKGKPPAPSDEPSGRSDAKQAMGADGLFPRDVVLDKPSDISGLHHELEGHIDSCGRPTEPSEFLKPWAYPLKNHAGADIGGEKNPSHPGPWMKADTARTLLQPGPGHAQARLDFEKAADPATTEAICETYLKNGQHLGNPVDYSLYLVGKLTQATKTDGPRLPDFNLDSDRGYAYHCWDWNRKVASLGTYSQGSGNYQDTSTRYDTYKQTFTGSQMIAPPDFSLLVPCTPPQGYCQGVDSQGHPINSYNPNVALAVHYLDGEAFDPGCPQSPTGPSAGGDSVTRGPPGGALNPPPASPLPRIRKPPSSRVLKKAAEKIDTSISP